MVALISAVVKSLKPVMKSFLDNWPCLFHSNLTLDLNKGINTDYLLRSKDVIYHQSLHPRAKMLQNPWFSFLFIIFRMGEYFEVTSHGLSSNHNCSGEQWVSWNERTTSLRIAI